MTDKPKCPFGHADAKTYAPDKHVPGGYCRRCWVADYEFFVELNKRIFGVEK